MSTPLPSEEELGQQIMSLYGTLSQSQIARKLNITRSKVRNWIKKCCAKEKEKEKGVADTTDDDDDDDDDEDSDDDSEYELTYLLQHKHTRNSPAYWREDNKRVRAVIRQLGLPHLLIILSSAESDWFPLMKILCWNNLGYELSFEEFNDETKFPSHLKCQLIDSDPISCVLHFENTLQQLLKTFKSPRRGPFHSFVMEDFYYRIRYREDGSPQVRFLLWLKNAPRYWKKDDVINCEEFLDTIMTCSNVPHPLVKKFQTNEKPNFPMDRTRILEPEGEDEGEEEDDHRRRLKDRFDSIRNHLSTITIKEDMTFDAFLSSLHLTLDEYLRILRVGIEKPTVFLKRDVEDMYIKPYNPFIVDFWQAPMDIRYVLKMEDCAPCLDIPKTKRCLVGNIEMFLTVTN